MSLDWRGRDVRRRVINAAEDGIDQTMSHASRHAKNNHPWMWRTGKLEESIRPVEQAQERGTQVIGVWGSVDKKYAVFLELGTVKMRAFPYLRPAADAEYPKLTGRIRAALSRGR